MNMRAESERGPWVSSLAAMRPIVTEGITNTRRRGPNTAHHLQRCLDMPPSFGLLMLLFLFKVASPLIA